jgi:hypothetical protein
MQGHHLLSDTVVSKRIVRIDPDGSQDPGLLVLIRGETGVIYEHQCGGHNTFQYQAEGYLVPIGPPSDSQGLRQFFEYEFKNWPPYHGLNPSTGTEPAWSDSALATLENLVGSLRIWHRDGAGEDNWTQMTLDKNWPGEFTEAWLPVSTPLGQGILLWENSD